VPSNVSTRCSAFPALGLWFCPLAAGAGGGAATFGQALWMNWVMAAWLGTWPELSSI
jgi:hypothetical protein